MAAASSSSSPDRAVSLNLGARELSSAEIAALATKLVNKELDYVAVQGSGRARWGIHDWIARHAPMGGVYLQARSEGEGKQRVLRMTVDWAQPHVPPPAFVPAGPPKPKRNTRPLHCDECGVTDEEAQLNVDGHDFVPGIFCDECAQRFEDEDETGETQGMVKWESLGIRDRDNFRRYARGY